MRQIAATGRRAKPVKCSAGEERMREMVTYRQQHGVYAFESSNPLARRHADHDEAITNLRRRLQLPKETELTRDVERLLVRYYDAYDLNIRWYDEKIAELEQKQLAAVEHMKSLGLGALTLIVAATAIAILIGAGSGVIGAQLGFMIAGLIAALQIAGTGKDYKAQRGAFWKARAALKTRLYAFEDLWGGKVCDAQQKPKPDFATALALEIRAAHDIVELERQEYFDTFKSAADVVTTLQGALAPLATQGQALVQATRGATRRADDAVDDARKADLLAAAKVTIAQAQLKGLAGRPDDDADVKAARLALIKAEAEKAGTEFLLQSAIVR
jgi:hypothetical protein